MCVIVLSCELPIWWDPDLRLERLRGWLSGPEADWLPYGLFLFLFPICWCGLRGGPRTAHTRRWAAHFFLAADRSRRLAWALAVIVFVVAFWMSSRTGREFAGLPPAYHDEFSYLFQAQTIQSGRWSFPSFAPQPELFDQMHVLNEGRFASRYFPGNGLWIAVFDRWEDPWFGHRLAQAIVSMMVFWCGRELSNSGVGLLSGLLCAFSPGLILFSNLLLAHLPTLVGLTVFLWAFLKLMSTDSVWMSLLAGTGLSYAMLCRPMTAAGFALPFGVAFVWWWFVGRWPTQQQADTAVCSHSVPFDPPRWQLRTWRVVVMATPLLVGFLVIAWQNQAITGDPLRTPYGIYNDIYTPRHVYGFNNVVRGARESGPLATDAYDRWADNLTWSLAWNNVGVRILNSWRWTLGVVPLSIAGIIFVLTPRQGDRRWLLILASILTLHLAHVPYWFRGIMGWHYVFESSICWLLIFSEVTRRLLRQWRDSGRWLMPWCWMSFVGLSVAVNLQTIEPIWPARLDRGVAELRFPRERYRQFREEIERLRSGQPAIVFVIPDRSDVSMDYVTNPPSLIGPVLIGRIPDRAAFAAAAAHFPERIPILFDAARHSFEIPSSPAQQTPQ